MIEEKYSKLKAKYNLPDFKEINDFFEISTIEKDDFLLREIRRKIADKVSLFAGILGGVVSTEPTPASMIEFGNIEESDAKRAFEIYKKLMYWERYSAEIGAIGDEKNDAKFIKEFYEEWKTLRNDVAELIGKLKEAWKKGTKGMEEGYFL